MVGPFRVRRVLASGTLGPRLLVEDDRGRLQVLKLITDVTDDAQALADLLDQVRQSLPPHPALLPVTEVGTSEEGVYLASPVLNAPSVEGRLRGGRQTLEATLPWLRAVTAGLQAAHDAGVWHGAIHPRDVLVTDEGGVLTGAGVAPALEHLKLQAPVRVPFTAPERASGRAWDARADQYSLAMLALDALSGRRLIAGTIPAFDRWTLAETPTEDARLHDVFVRALDPDPDQRYLSIEEWLTALAGPDRVGESGALSRFARDGVILATPAAALEAGREIKIQSIDDPKGDSLALFPEEGSSEHAADAPEASGADGATTRLAADSEQEWLVADVPDESTSREPEATVVVGRAASVPEADRPVPDRPTPDWSFDEPARPGPLPQLTAEWAPEADETPTRRPWLVAAVLLVLATVGYGTWLSMQAPSVPATDDVPAGRTAQGEAAPAPLERPAEPASPAPSASAPVTTPAPAPKSVPQAPVPARRAGAAVPPASSATRVEPRAVETRPSAGGRVLIRSSPAGEVRVNGVMRGETPVVLRDLPFGSYAITITRPGFEPVQREVSLLASQPVASLSVDLVRQGTAGPVASPPPTAPASSAARPAAPEPVTSSAPAPAASTSQPAGVAATGGIYVTSTPTGARLLVDGQPYGSTPAAIPGLTPGSHVVRVEAPGYRTWEGRVAVLSGIRVPVQAALQQEQK